MRSKSDRRQRGAIRLEIVVVVLLLFALFGLFMQRVLELQRGMERVIVDAEVVNLRTELQMAVASRIVRGEEGGLKEWVRRNPLELAGREIQSGMPPPASAGGAELSTAWQWDAAQEALTYRYAGGEVVRLRLGLVPLAGRDGWVLGGGLLLLRERTEGR